MPRKIIICRLHALACVCLICRSKKRGKLLKMFKFNPLLYPSPLHLTLWPLCPLSPSSSSSLFPPPHLPLPHSPPPFPSPPPPPPFVTQKSSFPRSYYWTGSKADSAQHSQLVRWPNDYIIRVKHTAEILDRSFLSS